METAWAAINSAADTIKSLHAPSPASSPAPADELQKTLVSTMIQRLTAAPDPIETFAKMAALMRESTPASNGGIVAGSAEDKLIAILIERALNPPAPPAPSPVADLGAELERTLPLLTPFITASMESWARITAARRAIRQAQADSTRPGNQPPASST
jgi:hypothetical protein